MKSRHTVSDVIAIQTKKTEYAWKKHAEYS